MAKKIFSLNVKSLSKAGDKGIVLVNGQQFNNRTLNRVTCKESDLENYIVGHSKKLIEIVDIKNLITGEDVTVKYVAKKEKAPAKKVEPKKEEVKKEEPKKEPKKEAPKKAEPKKEEVKKEEPKKEEKEDKK